MEISPAVPVRRPQRWDQPLDPAMTDHDVAWLRTRKLFAAMRDDAFPKATPLNGILANDCRILHLQRGEIVVREGDYGNSAFLVVSGSVRVSLEKLPDEVIGRDQPEKKTWSQAIRQVFRPRQVAEVRDTQSVNAVDSPRVDSISDRPAVFLQDFSSVFRDVKSMSLGPGELFGEIAAMYRTPQTATVVAEDEATLVEIRWQGLRLLRRDRAFSEQLEKHYRDQWLLLHLRETPLLRFVPDDALKILADATLMRSFGRMEWNTDFDKIRKLPVQEQIEREPLIAIEGHLPTDLILIRSGFARVSSVYGAGHQTTAYLGKGHVFGFSELAYNVMRNSQDPPQQLRQSLRAVGFVDTLHIPIELAADYLLPYIRRSDLPRIHNPGPLAPRQPPREGERRSSNRDRPGEAMPKKTTEPVELVSTGLLEFMVQERLTNAKQAMVIDLNRCTRCDDCVKACAATHDGNPRMTRTGNVHDGLMFAQACMHCTDPVCMIGCPTGAISRNSATGTVFINEPICIGCGTCANSCPYQNISMVAIRDASGKGFVDEASGLPILKATKCDLCQKQPSGPACQNACPHDALVRIDLSHLGPLDDWLGRRA